MLHAGSPIFIFFKFSIFYHFCKKKSLYFCISSEKNIIFKSLVFIIIMWYSIVIKQMGKGVLKMWFPLFINLENKKVLVIGGGKVASKKIEKIVESRADITVVAENIKEEKLLQLENIKIENNKKIENDKDKIEKIVNEYFFVIAATNDEKLNENIADVCDSNGILVNNVSSKMKMNTMFGGIVKNDEFQIAVSTGGKNCKRSRAMKSEIQKILDKLENKNI